MEGRKAPETRRGTEKPKGLETPSLDVGTKVEVTRLDGTKGSDVFSGLAHIGGKEYHVFARFQDHTVAYRILPPEELDARAATDRRLAAMQEAYDNDLDASIKAAGLTGEEAQKTRAALVKRGLEIITDSIWRKEPEPFMVKQIQEGIEKPEETTPVSLGELQRQHGELAREADRAYQADDQQKYNGLILQVRALETQINKRRQALSPDAEPEERAMIVNETEGFVSPLPDALYDEGLDGAQARVAQLEQEMDTAEKAGNAAAYVTAQDERNRHRAMLPVLERVQTLQETAKEQADLLKQAKEAGVARVKAERQTVKVQRDFWRNAEDAVKAQLDEMDLQMQGIREGLRTNLGPDAGAKREALEARYARIHERLKKAQQELMALETAHVDVTFDPDQKIDGAQTALYRSLRDLWTEQPDQVGAFAEQALASEKTPESTRAILNVFDRDAKEGVFTHEEPLIPAETREERMKAEQDLEEGRVDVEELKEQAEWSAQFENMPDLRRAGIINERADLDAWMDTYYRVIFALNKLGLTPADEGLPESYNALMDLKDSRGFVGKLFGKKTDRVKGFEKLADVHYRYVDSGKVDMTGYVARAKLRAAAHQKQMTNAGRGTIIG